MKKRPKGKKRNPAKPLSSKQLAAARGYAGKHLTGKTDREILQEAGYSGAEKQMAMLKRLPRWVAEVNRLKASETRQKRMELDEIRAGMEAMAKGHEPTKTVEGPKGTYREFDTFGAHAKLLAHLAPAKPAEFRHSGAIATTLLSPEELMRLSDEELAELFARMSAAAAAGAIVQAPPAP